ncbi:class E sortase [Acrocarpospora catenulata]|uniref:class E sortase n=1 Tax=Acrocarpospora catenulata TaxID=2836182 RepID=UPI001BD97342|nr:class E sortase [Acrocarpospora catenulata]
MRIALARIIHGVGELILTAGVLLVLFAAYGLYGTAAETEAEQDRLNTVFHTGPLAAAPPPARESEPVSVLDIPRLKKSWVVVEGVSQKALKKGPGHYPETADPGEVGNFAVAAHRTPSFFWDLDLLREGDEIVAETRSTRFVYRVVRQRIVTPGQVEVIDPNPDAPGAPARREMLTLTTCHPRMANYQRLVVHAELAESLPKGAA